jgi:hypothetical protein
VSWTYSGDPSASPSDEVRFLLGDTNVDDPLLTDAEILYLVNTTPNPLTAAAFAASALAAKYARLMDKSVGPISVSYSQKYEHFKDLANDLSTAAGGTNMAVAPIPMYVGGLSHAEKQANRTNEDLVQPAFRREMFNPTEQPVANVRIEDEELP